jgi:hypothetical protein
LRKINSNNAKTGGGTSKNYLFWAFKVWSSPRVILLVAYL